MLCLYANEPKQASNHRCTSSCCVVPCPWLQHALACFVATAVKAHTDRDLRLRTASVDGLIEASRQSRVCGGVANEIQCRIFLILMEVRDFASSSVASCMLRQPSVSATLNPS